MCKRQGEAMNPRHQPVFFAMALLAWAAWGVACAPEASARRVVASYDEFTSRLIVLSADQNGDGRIDQWTYLNDNRPLRGEADLDADGRIDRWEYFGAQADLVKVGTSSRNDGVEDTWTWVVPLNGEGRVDIALKRDRQIDRREFFQGPTLVRAELDTNADGKSDRWDRYEGGVLREARFDTSLSGARANWRILYDGQGRFVATEADLERDGTFVPATAGGVGVVRGGRQ